MNILDFRVWLAQQLGNRIAEIRAGFQERIPTSDELDLIYALQQLLGDTGNVSEYIFVLFKKMVLIEKFRSNLINVSHDVFRKIRVETAPDDATGLVRQLIIDSLQYDSLNPRHQRPPASSHNGAHHSLWSTVGRPLNVLASQLHTQVKGLFGQSQFINPEAFASSRRCHRA